MKQPAMLRSPFLLRDDEPELFLTFTVADGDGHLPPGSHLQIVLECGEVGIRVEQRVETAGLDVSEHGMWGYPEFYIPVPGGYGTESHGHLALGHGHSARPHPAGPVPVARSAPEPST